MTAAPPYRPRPPALSASADPSAADAAELWTITDLIAFLPWRRSTVYRLTRQPWFPAALELPGPTGPRRVWLAAEIRAWALAAPRSHGRGRVAGTADTPSPGPTPGGRAQPGPAGPRR